MAKQVNRLESELGDTKADALRFKELALNNIAQLQNQSQAFDLDSFLVDTSTSLQYDVSIITLLRYAFSKCRVEEVQPIEGTGVQGRQVLFQVVDALKTLLELVQHHESLECRLYAAYQFIITISFFYSPSLEVTELQKNLMAYTSRFSENLKGFELLQEARQQLL